MPQIPLEPTQSPPPNRAAAGELEARRGPVDSGGDRAQHLPQKLPHALAVLVRLTFDYPEPFFTRTTGDPSATAAIDADEHDSCHPKPEHRHW